MFKPRSVVAKIVVKKVAIECDSVNRISDPCDSSSSNVNSDVSTLLTTIDTKLELTERVTSECPVKSIHKNHESDSAENVSETKIYSSNNLNISNDSIDVHIPFPKSLKRKSSGEHKVR